MYTFSNKLRMGAIILMVVGLLGIVYGFLSAPGTPEEAMEIIAASSHEDHGAETHVVKHEEAVTAHHGEEAHEVHATGHDKEHAHHVFSQLQNKPWAALYVAAFFFMMISLGTLAFYAINRAAQAGWSPVLFRVMEGITAYLLPGAVLMIVIWVVANLGDHHLFIWTNKEVVDSDHLLQGKSSYLNMTAFIIRAVVYIGGWVAYRQISRKFSIAQDTAEDDSYFKKNFRASAIFLVFFLVTESMMSWDWIMSVEPHWFSTLFGWYVFASMFVSGITMIAIVTLYLKSKGYLEYVNDSHIHDLGKFMFGISIFWTYLWFSQFMLYWYSNIPEEVGYFVQRIRDYQLPFFGMIALNFLFPLLILMNSDFKRKSWFIIMTGCIILFGHYLDIYNMIMPSTVGDQWFIGIPEIASILFFLGLFILVVFTALTKVPLLAKRNPFIEESKHFHY
ncbi:quinol:cytochrome C oxidoreductase [Neptunitalea chrysea]|uniref:Quinol:cytochrome C oxidoreductase n=1 Tax=Neptunitalea chrysea TaxID=1647581 RepID=A0A9W6B5A7_9FLAO|nr:quinol:cytochrome C oxidoreductase [Neptunitalea chrysea]GLB50998.1 quinol:cytochrome C oxidoreductase [Neptunitalea chrysea]